MRPRLPLDLLLQPRVLRPHHLVHLPRRVEAAPLALLASDASASATAAGAAASDRESAEEALFRVLPSFPVLRRVRGGTVPRGRHHDAYFAFDGLKVGAGIARAVASPPRRRLRRLAVVHRVQDQALFFGEGDAARGEGGLV